MELQTSQLKYRLKEMMENQPVKKYKHDVRTLPALTGKCKNTIKGYSEILVNAKSEMPYLVGCILEDYYKLPPRGLYNDLENTKAALKADDQEVNPQ